MSVQPGLQFVDTNVLVYAHDTSAGIKRDLCGAVAGGVMEVSPRLLEHSGAPGVLDVNITRKVAQPLESGAAAQILADRLVACANA